jgi:L-ribulokinase
MDVTVDGTGNYVIGVDYGTLSGRAVVVRVRDGKELESVAMPTTAAGSIPASAMAAGTAWRRTSR